MIKALSKLSVGVALLCAAALPMNANADNLLARAVSGHTDNWGHVMLVKEKFLPVIKQRIADETDHTINIVEGWGGTIAKAAEVLEAVETGVATFGVYCVCHDADKLALHNFMYYMPFGPTSTGMSVAATRKVYDEYPELKDAFERYNQKLLALIPLDGYDLVTKFEVKSRNDVAGKMFGGAGPNLSWISGMGRGISQAGAEGYSNLETGLTDGTISSQTINRAIKLYEVAPYYTTVGFGAFTIVVLTVNKDWFDRLPPGVQNIVSEAAAQMEKEAGPFWDAIESEAKLHNQANGQINSNVPADVRQAWAESLVNLPREKAQEIGKDQIDLWKRVMQSYYDAAVGVGYTWPVTFNIQ